MFSVIASVRSLVEQCLEIDSSFVSHLVWPSLQLLFSVLCCQIVQLFLALFSLGLLFLLRRLVFHSLPVQLGYIPFHTHLPIIIDLYSALNILLVVFARFILFSVFFFSFNV